MSWALRALSKRNPEQTLAFIEQYRDRLHSGVIREVRNKLRTGLKNPRPKQDSAKAHAQRSPIR
jgi:hypothetical protein